MCAYGCAHTHVYAPLCRYWCRGAGWERGQEAAEGVSPWDEPQRPWDPRVLNMLDKVPSFP